MYDKYMHILCCTCVLLSSTSIIVGLQIHLLCPAMIRYFYVPLPIIEHLLIEFNGTCMCEALCVPNHYSIIKFMQPSFLLQP